MLLTPTLAFASGGSDMLTIMVWFYTLVTIMHGALVLLLRNLLLYKYLWITIISLLFSIASLVVWWFAFTTVVAYLPEEIFFLVASAIGLSLYLIIVIWAVMTPIKQYRQLEKEQ